MQETIEQLLGYLRGIWRRRWLVLIATWLACAIGWVWIYLLQNEYEAQARVYVDTQSLLKPLLAGLAVQPNVQQQVAMMTRTLLSRPNLEKVARMTDLDVSAKTPKETEALYLDLSKRIGLEGTDRENLYTISFIHSNPDLGKRMVQALLTIFTESSLGNTRKDLTNTQKFIDDQLKGYEDKLKEKEKQLEEFKRRNVGNLQGSGGDYFTRLTDANTTLERAKLDLEEAANRTMQLRQQLEDQEEVVSTPLPAAPPVAGPLDGRIAALQTQLDSMRLRFTDLHPEIQRIKQLIASLQEQKRKEQEAQTTNATPATAKAQNPIYQQLTIALAEAEANTASLKARVAQLQSRRDELMRKVDQIPTIESEYTQLVRDYDVYKANYAQLLDRREKAVMTGEVETKTDSVDFRVIDPPRVSNKPVKPNRPLLITATPLAGLSTGVAIALILVQLRPTVDSRRQLRELTGLPLLGTVTRVETDLNRRRKRRLNLTYAAAVASLLVAYAALLVYYLAISPAA